MINFQFQSFKKKSIVQFSTNNWWYQKPFIIIGFTTFGIWGFEVGGVQRLGWLGSGQPKGVAKLVVTIFYMSFNVASPKW